jgi:hypothetical protein
MAIATNDFALCDFCAQCPQRHPVCDQAGYGESLVLDDVVEFENHDVALAAIDARVFTQVGEDVLPVPRNIAVSI